MVLENNPDGDVLQLTLPATSIFGKEDGDKRGLQAYARYLAVQSPPVNPEQIVTRMKFDIQSESPKLTFQPQRWLTEDEYEISLKQGANPDADRAVVMTAAQADGVKAAPMRIAGTAPKPVAKPMGEMMDEDDTAAVAKAKVAFADNCISVAEVVAEVVVVVVALVVVVAVVFFNFFISRKPRTIAEAAESPQPTVSPRVTCGDFIRILSID